MKHAGPDALDTLEPLLARLRAIEGAREKGRGVFYVKSRAFLHFHEDSSGLYADLRPPGANDFQRLKADGDQDQRTLIARVETALRGA
jgi:hypothetical protein